jgi:hypothetical protein
LIGSGDAAAWGTTSTILRQIFDLTLCLMRLYCRLSTINNKAK